MNRAEFMAAVHELAEKLGTSLYTAFVRQAEVARAQALETAKSQLRAEIGGDPAEDELPSVTGAGARRRKQQRCSKCQSTEHNARRCDADPASAEEADEDDSPAEIESPPPQPAPPIASHASRRRPPRVAPPTGWTVEGDRREEFAALSELVLIRKCS